MKFMQVGRFVCAMVLGLILGPVHAATVLVDSYANSTTGGTGADVFNVTAGQSLSISALASELWGAGEPFRISNASGLAGNSYAANGQTLNGASIIWQTPPGYGAPIAVGTQLGQSFGNWTQNGITAPYGVLVASIGSVYQVVGTSFSGVAWGTGALKLWYHDSYRDDNFGAINVTAAVPEPHEWAMMVAGLGVIGWVARRRRSATA